MSSLLAKKSNVLLVLGMHRSGTSCLTGLLQQAGLVLGDVIEEAPYNKKGNREHPSIMQLNEAVLAANNAAWDSPPPYDAELHWNSGLKDQRDDLIRSLGGHRLWGCKDPRMLLLLPFWLEGLQHYHVHFIGTFRHPLSVALSLQARQPDMSLEHGVKLWQHYNNVLMHIHEKYSFPLVDFDSEITLYKQQVQDAVKQTALFDVADMKQCDFFDESLRHQSALDKHLSTEHAAVLKNVMPLYTALKECVA